VAESSPSPADPPPPRALALDRGRLDELSRHLGDDVEPLLDRFLERLADAPAGLERGAASGDLEELASLAHSLKSVAGTFGVVELSATCAALEQAARGRDAGRARRCAAEAAAQSERGAIAIAEWREDRPGA
jgi:HPt (histidine-containing phosphotransfer) domain-containing protein